jgi:8-amino-7-oxononanoate synthase
MSVSPLSVKLATALASRDERRTRRRLPHTHTAASSPRIDFNSNDYLSLSTDQRLRNLFLQKLKDAPDILGACGSRLLVNGKAHAALEERLRTFYGWEAVLLFNSGYDANIGFFSSIPQSGDVIVHDEYIHASVYDGMKASRVPHALFPFSHNSLQSLRQVLEKLLVDRPGLRSGATSAFLVVESVYSMEGTFSPLLDIVELLESLFPKRNAHLVVDEVHATGIYGPKGRGRVAELRLESKVLACLHTFGKALAASGGASPLVRHHCTDSERQHRSGYLDQRPGS